ncbi:hypothetical protein ABT023_16410 [Micromonospora sp. NPDC002296]|uniref:hypothetical protein n=1 Tax=Micromonospora sp. NPDC002296 TaxID=3154271 RepID=UPI00332C3A9A
MNTATGQSHRRDPGARTPTSIDGDTGQLQLPTASAAGTYSTGTPPPWTLSGLLAVTLCVATVFTIATVVLTVIEETRNSAAVTGTTMLLLIVGGGISWIIVSIVVLRDWVTRGNQALGSMGETLNSRQTELYRRQDHLAHRITDLANRQAEQMRLLRDVAADMAAVRREIADVIGVADADAELQLRQAVNGQRQPTGLYVVPPEPST